MKVVSCEVIQDLIPLYVEDMLSEDSKKLVETHLDECEECREYLETLRTMNSLPIETDTQPLKKIQKNIQKKKWYAVIIAVLITLLLGTVMTIFTTSPKYIPYSDEVVTINESENGLISVAFNDEIAGYDIKSDSSESGQGTIYYLTTWTTTWHQFTQADTLSPFVLNLNGEPVKSIYYYQTDGTADTLIYGEDLLPNGEFMTLQRLSLNYLIILATVALLIGLITMYFVRTNKIYLKRAMKVTLLPLVYIVANVIVTGWDATTYSSTRDFAAILLIAILIYGIILLVFEIRKNQQAK